MEVPEVILYMDYNMTLACYPWSLLIYYLLTDYTLIYIKYRLGDVRDFSITIEGESKHKDRRIYRNKYILEVE